MSEQRDVDFDKRTIPFTQYLLPNGERRAVETGDPMYTDDDLKRAQEFIDAGFRFEVELLTNSVVSMTISDDEGDYVHQTCMNGQNVPVAICALIRTYDLHGLQAVKKAMNEDAAEEEIEEERDE